MNGVFVATGADERGDGGDGMTMTLCGRRAYAHQPCKDRISGKDTSGAPVSPAAPPARGRRASIPLPERLHRRPPRPEELLP